MYLHQELLNQKHRMQAVTELPSEEGESIGIGRECLIGSLAVLSSIESAVLE